MLTVVKLGADTVITTAPPTARSLADVHSSVGTADMPVWRRMFAFAGPAYLVSVGYMDPGNWATDLEGGARFGYRSAVGAGACRTCMAILLQTLSARLGIVTGRDLAQACRETYPRPVTIALWVLCEIAIAACDLAEVLGAAIALNLLFHIPLLIGVLLTAADTLLLLWFQSFGIRVHRSVHPGADRGDGGLLLHRDRAGPSRSAVASCCAGLMPRINGTDSVRRHRHPGRHGDAAQSVSAFGAGADAPASATPRPASAAPAAST